MSRLLLAVACLPLFSQTLPHDADSPLRRSSSSPQLRSRDGEWKFLGNLNANRFDPDSVSNPYGRYGSPFSPDSVNNPFGRYGSLFSPYSARNPHAASAPAILSPRGEYLGSFSSNPYHPDSVANPSGRYGSRFSPDSINNPFGRYGSPFSPESANYPYGASAPPLPVTPLRVRPLPSLVPHSQR